MQDGHHKCTLCSKLFESQEFAVKHITNKHPEALRL
jgi:hypothetical protein